MSDRELLDAVRRRAHILSESLSYKVRYGSWPYVYFSDKPRCRVLVGEGTYSGIISVVANKGQTLKIGKYTSIGHRLDIMMSSGHRADSISTYPFREISVNFSPDQSFVVGDISIGNDCWIGSDVMLLGGCTLGDGVVLGAKSLVTSKQRLEDYGVYGGSPAKLLYFRFDKKTRDALKKLKWWNLPKSVIDANMELFYGDDINESIRKISKLVKK